MQAIKDRIKAALLGVMFFVVFQPVQFPAGGMRYVAIVLLTLVSVLTCVAVELVVTYILGMPNDTSKGFHYIARRNMLFMPLNICCQTFAMALLFDWVAPETSHLSKDCLLRILLCMMCVTFMQSLLWRSVYRSRILTAELSEAQRLNGILQERERCTPMATTAKQMVQICGTTREEIRLDVNDLLYAESDGNYVCVYHLADGEVRSANVRTSIKAIGDQLSDYGNVVRCHRAFVVNLRMVRDVERRSSGLMLNMRHGGLKVPVSKSYQQEIKYKLQNPE